MQILYMAFYSCSGNEAYRLAAAEDLSSFNFFMRSSVREQLVFNTRTFAARTAPGTRQALSLQDIPYRLLVYCTAQNIAGCCVVDQEYPERVAFTFLGKVVREIELQHGDETDVKEDIQMDLPNLEAEFKRYQNPQEADKLLQVQKNLDDVKDVMHKNIDEVLRRGETLDSLMVKSNDLSKGSYEFYRTAKRNNQCCKMY